MFASFQVQLYYTTCGGVVVVVWRITKNKANSADSGTAANTSEEIMNVGEVRIAEDSDFALLKVRHDGPDQHVDHVVILQVLLTRGDGWTQEYSSGSTQVSTRPAENSHFR